MFSVALAVYGP